MFVGDSTLNQIHLCNVGVGEEGKFDASCLMVLWKISTVSDSLYRALSSVRWQPSMLKKVYSP